MARKTITSKKHLVLILSLLVIPLIICLLFYNYYTLQSLNSNVAQSSGNIIEIYQKQLENQLKNLSIKISDYWANDYNHKKLILKTDNLSVHLAGVEIAEKYLAILYNNKNVGGVFLFSQANNISRYTFQERRYDAKTKEEIEKYVTTILRNPTKTITRGWVPIRLRDRSFLFRMLGYNGGYTVIMIDLQATIEEQSNNVDESEGFLLYCNSQGEALTNNDSVRDEDLILSKFNDLYYVTQSSPRHLVVSSYSDSANAYILYFTPYRGYLFYMSKIQMIFFIISISMILLIPFYYRIISKSYFKPMANLMSTMEKIRDGSINEKVQIDFRIKELLDINMTFNQMMDEIKHLKIESYERELQRKQAFLQYLQMQIKPHFFLNCLKILYSMAEQRKYDKIQNMIIGLSNYLRNFFKDNMSLVTIKYEIEYVENYINLQKNSMQQDVECIIETDNSIVNYCIPVLLIQTFVENCIKYARKPDESLSIQINIIELTLEDNKLIDIIIQDNGYGFKEEILEQLNSDVTFEYSDKNVGITNVKQRLYLLYGEKANVQFSNTKQGARCEIIIPATIKPVSGANDEHIDYR